MPGAAYLRRGAGGAVVLAGAGDGWGARRGAVELPVVKANHADSAINELLANGSVTPAGEGDGQFRELLLRLGECGYRGFLSVEPHLEGGSDSMERVVTSIRRLLVEGGYTETDVPGTDS